MEKGTEVTSAQITQVLAAQHTNDVFVAECKDGPTQCATHNRLDVWVMNRSWSRPLVVGYEIKVSRSDFGQDNKWHTYLELCNQLFFVCPKGLIKPEEVPDGVGLKYATAKRALVVKKAAHRDQPIPESLYRYLLMCRTRVVPPNFYDTTEEQKRLQWREWLNKKDEDLRLGYQISNRIRDHVDKVNQENARLKAENAELQDAKRILSEMGVNLHAWHGGTLSQRIEAALKQVPQELMDAICDLERYAGETRIKLERMNATPQTA
jgi:hypothetical protein